MEFQKRNFFFLWKFGNYFVNFCSLSPKQLFGAALLSPELIGGWKRFIETAKFDLRGECVDPCNNFWFVFCPRKNLAENKFCADFPKGLVRYPRELTVSFFAPKRMKNLD